MRRGSASASSSRVPSVEPSSTTMISFSENGTARAALAGPLRAASTGSSCTTEPRQGRGPAHGLRRGHRRRRDRAGRRPRVRPGRVPAPARSRSSTGSADVVFGSRFLGGSAHRVLYFWHSRRQPAARRTLSNMFTNLNLTDMETCYKVFRREVHPGASRSRRTASASSRRSPPRSRGCGCRIYEVGITYTAAPTRRARRSAGRTASARSVCILKYNLRPN